MTGASDRHQFSTKHQLSSVNAVQTCRARGTIRCMLQGKDAEVRVKQVEVVQNTHDDVDCVDDPRNVSQTS